MTPDEFTNQEFRLNVGDGHELYVQDWGNIDAKTPIMYLHGGPGSGCRDNNKFMFDPSVQRVIFHDQRGSGKSTPPGKLEHNTTTDLVEDIEKIATALKLKTFIVTGGSWGSALSLAYALKYPKCVHALVVSGIFTGSSQEIKYLDNGLFRTHFPDAWDRYLAVTPKEFHDNPSSYHFPRILGKDKSTAIESGKAYEELEGSIAKIDERWTPPTYDETYSHLPIRTEVHYMVNGCFMEDRHILNNAHKLTMPLWIIQGRYDFVCPPLTAYELSQKAPNAQIIWTQAGHGRNDRETATARNALLLQMSLG